MEQVSQRMMCQRQPRMRLIRAVAMLLFIYALIEVMDCLTAILMAFGMIDNPYPTMLFKEMQALFDTQPIWLVPLFLFFTSVRITAAIGLWKNRMWGFWITIFGLIATLMMAPFLLPLTAAEMLMDGVLIIILLVGFFGDMPIVEAPYA